MRPIIARLTCVCILCTSLSTAEAAEFLCKWEFVFNAHFGGKPAEKSRSGESSVAFGPTRKLGTVVSSDATANYHTAVLADLEPGRMYYYRIGMKLNGKRRFSPVHELDGRMNYAMPAIDDAEHEIDGIADVVTSLKQPGGYTVILGVEPAKTWSLPIAANTKMSVVAACADADQVQQLRQAWYDEGVYGVRLSAQLDEQIPAQIANLVVCESKSFSRAVELLSPTGSLVSLDEPTADAQWTWKSHRDQFWIGRRTHELELTDWGHQYGSSANGSYVGEDLGGIDSTEQLSIRWLGRPGDGLWHRPQSTHARTAGDRRPSVSPRNESYDRIGCVQWFGVVVVGDSRPSSSQHPAGLFELVRRSRVRFCSDRRLCVEDRRGDRRDGRNRSHA